MSDVKAVRTIASLSFDKAWSEKEFWYFLTHDCNCSFGSVEVPTRAYLIGLLVQGDLDIISMATHPDWRGRGFAGELLRNARNHPMVRRIFLEVDKSNASAIALYGRSGFLRLGVKPRYYEGKKDALVFRYEKRVDCRGQDTISSPVRFCKTWEQGHYLDVT